MQPDRTSYIGGSDAGPIMRGQWLDVWLLKTNQVEREDLSDVFEVQLGIFTEEFNRLWIEKRMNIKVDFPIDFVSDGYRGGSVDGLTDDGGILECKHVNQFWNETNLIDYYFPQMQHYLALYPDRTHCWFSFIHGNSWKCTRILRDDHYIEELLSAERSFWHHVENNISPSQGSPLDTPEWEDANELSLVRMDMTKSNAWAHSAIQWTQNQKQHKKFDEAAKSLKSLMPENAYEASGHGVTVKRNKRGSLLIKLQEKENADTI